MYNFLHTRYSYQILMKLEFSRHIFDKYSNIKFNENPSSGSRVVPRGQTGHNEANSRLFAILRTRIMTMRDRGAAIPMYDRRKVQSTVTEFCFMAEQPLVDLRLLNHIFRLDSDTQTLGRTPLDE